MKVAVLSFHSHSDRSFLDDRELAVLSGDLRGDGIENDLFVTVLSESGVTGAEPTDAVVERLISRLSAYRIIAFQRVWRLDLIARLRGALRSAKFVFCEGEHPVDRAPADYVCVSPLADSLGELVRTLEHGGGTLPAGVYVPGRNLTLSARPQGKQRAFAPNLNPIFINPDALPSFTSFAVLGNSGCPYQADARNNPVYRGVTLPEGTGRGCAFCSTGNTYTRRPDVVPHVYEQLDVLRRSERGLRHFVLKDQNPFVYLDDLLGECAARGLGDFTLLLETRADWFLKHEARLVRALDRAAEARIVIAPYLVGIENFSQRELDRFNKGISAERNEQFLSALFRWKSEHRRAFGLSHASFGFVLFTPWTTLDDLRLNRDAIRRTRFHELRGKILLSRARLYPDNALYHLAERDGLFEARFAKGEDNSARFGYLPAQPWRFQHEEVAHFSRLAAELSEERTFRDETRLFDVLVSAFDERDYHEITLAGLRRELASSRLALAPAAGGTGRSRAARVHTNRRCNQACIYCTRRSPSDDLGAIAAPEIRRRIAEARRDGAETLVLTGGEPTLRRDLAELVAFARSLAFHGVELETNATQIDAAAAAGLAAAGLSLARVNLAVFGEELDAITRDPGGFAATRRGTGALMAARIPVEVATALVKSTLDGVSRLPQALVEHLPGVLRLVVHVPVRSPDSEELLPPAEAAQQLRLLSEQCRRAGLALALDPDSFLPPCLFPSNARPEWAHRLSPGGADRGGYRKLSACSSCLVSDRCPGLAVESLERFGEPAVTPVREERARRRLTLTSSVDEQIERELVTLSLYRNPVGDQVTEAVIRVNFRCNQSCDFCFVSTHLPEAPHERVVRAIREAASRGARIVLSGGEPSLNPRLADYVRLARSVSHAPVEVQTNAVRFEDAEFVAALVDAGLSRAFVSLHGSSASVSDAITRAPGTFERSVRGVDALVASSVAVVLNFVICQKNRETLPDYVAFVAERWPGMLVNLSFVAPSSDLVPRESSLIPRYSEVIPALSRALEAAERLGVGITGFDSMCGIPLCLVPTSLERYFTLAELPAGSDKGEFLKPPACEACALSKRCFGLRRGYAELYGSSELRPVMPRADLSV